MSTKHKICPDCKGRGRIFKLSNGTVIDSFTCSRCEGTGKVKRTKND